jgi:sensor histidine kinase regulating citrate/malate metabolism
MSSNKSRSKNEDFIVVGIGASAGGLEATRKFLENIPTDTNLAFVIVQHLAETMMTTKSKGQGFGLAVVKRLTEGLGGTIRFESQEGK